LLLLAGLGNPGEGYARHRHNVGFLALDAIARRHRFAAERRRFEGRLAEGQLSGRKVIALKPATFMNDSGRSVGQALRYFRLEPAELVVFHDELDLAPGKLRVKRGGGAAGHNGLRSLDAHIGPDYRRVRIGIGHPGRRELVHPYVLSDFGADEWSWLAPLLEAIAEAAPLLAQDQDDRFATKVAALLRPPKPSVPAPIEG